jgi:hypothetical protein
MIVNSLNKEKKDDELLLQVHYYEKRSEYARHGELPPGAGPLNHDGSEERASNTAYCLVCVCRYVNDEKSMIYRSGPKALQ